MYTQRLHVEDLQSSAGRVRRRHGVRAHEARPGDPDRAVGAAAAGTGVVVHAMHPGWVDTPGLEASLPRFYGAHKAAAAHAAARAPTRSSGSARRPSRRASSGRFWHDRRERPTHRVPWTRGDARRPRAAVGGVRATQRSARGGAKADRTRLRQRKEITMARYKASVDTPRPPERGVRLPERLLDDRRVGSRRRRSRAARRARRSREGTRVSAAWRDFLGPRERR